MALHSSFAAALVLVLAAGICPATAASRRPTPRAAPVPVDDTGRYPGRSAPTVRGTITSVTPNASGNFYGPSAGGSGGGGP